MKGVPAVIKRTAYISLVRSGLEYGAAIWAPHTKDQKRKIELVQNKAMRWICNLPPFDRTSISELQADTNLDSLEVRRRDARLTLMYKIVHQHVAITPESLDMVQGYSGTISSHK